MTPAKMATRFIMARRDVTEEDREWVRLVFGCIIKVARANRAFTVDLVWEQIELLRSRGKMPTTSLDQRIIGPMMRFAAFEGLIRPSGYYKKSTRAASGYRPITVWDSAVMQRRAA